MSLQEPQRIFSNLDLSRLIIPLIIEQFLSCIVGMVDTMMLEGIRKAIFCVRFSSNCRGAISQLEKSNEKWM